MFSIPHRKLALSIATLALAFVAAPAQADSRLVVENPRNLEFAVQGDRVYLRNLNQFDPTWLGCCYQYYIDLTTEGGRARYSTLLTYVISGQKFILYKDNPSLGGEISIVGNF